MDDGEVITSLIKYALSTPEARRQLANAERRVIGELERNRFNTERAIEIYAFAIDDTVWALCRATTLGRFLYYDFLQSGLGRRFAVDLTETFKAGFHPPLKDQRRPRWFLRFAFGT